MSSAANEMPITCGHCQTRVFARLVTGSRPGQGEPAWLLCPNCFDGSVRSIDGTVYPAAPAGRLVKNLPDDVNRAWREVRVAHSVGAYTAAEMMCRKILMHLAVAQAGADAGASFLAYVDALDRAGYISPGLRPVVDQIRTRGNIANHDLPASTEHGSLMTMEITEYLLHTIYELPGLLG